MDTKHTSFDSVLMWEAYGTCRGILAGWDDYSRFHSGYLHSAPAQALRDIQQKARTWIDRHTLILRGCTLDPALSFQVRIRAEDRARELFAGDCSKHKVNGNGRGIWYPRVSVPGCLVLDPGSDRE